MGIDGDCRNSVIDNKVTCRLSSDFNVRAGLNVCFGLIISDVIYEPIDTI